MATSTPLNDFEMMARSVERERDEARNELAALLEKLAEDARRDAQVVEDGGSPRYSTTYYSQRGAEVTDAQARLRALSEVARRLRHATGEVA